MTLVMLNYIAVVLLNYGMASLCITAGMLKGEMKMYNYTGPDEIVSITEYEPKKRNEYYMTWYIKDVPGVESKQFPTFEAGLKFALELDKDENLDCRSFVKKIKV